MTRSVDVQLSAEGRRFAIVAGRFNSFITEHLVKGAVNTLTSHGASEKDILIIHVPGAFEIPLACKKLAQSGAYHAVIALGAVIRGDTYHYELVCNEAARGVMQASLDTSIPVTFGVITADNIEQAIERAGCKAGNKGTEAAMAAIEMTNVLKEIEVGR
ncbi:MAG: 6,7-dimethyl-8-ribityllumazine synthase [Deltaproteobacteria bacterium]|nr:6,7-dimethyl-8-ribityllumazine synthase [Deltaproteobacteria bacterium]